MASWASIIKAERAAAPAPDVQTVRKDIKTAVVDTNAIINGLHLEGLAERYVTIPEVLREIRDKNARNFLSTLPYELKVLEPSDESVKIVTRFAQETGDSHCLSVVDMRLLALARTLEVEAYGSSKLRDKPLQIHTRGGVANGIQRQLPGWGAAAVKDAAGWREIDAVPDHVLSSGAGAGTSRIRSAAIGLMDDTADPVAQADATASASASAVPPPPAAVEKQPTGVAAAIASVVGTLTDSLAKLTTSAAAAAEASVPVTPAAEKEADVAAAQDNSDDDEWLTAGSSKNASRRRRRKDFRRQERHQQEWQAEEGAEAKLAAEKAKQSQKPAAETEVKQEEAKPAEPEKLVVPSVEEGEGRDAAGNRAEQEPQSSGKGEAESAAAAASEEDDAEEEEESEEEEEGEGSGDVDWVEGEDVDGREGGLAEEGRSATADGAAGPADGVQEAPCSLSGSSDPFGSAAATAADAENAEDAALFNSTSSVFSVTADFAMQNVLLQMGLRLISRDGRQIKRVTRWALRCSACFAVTGEVGRVFCPRCGNMTLERVEVNVGPDGAVLYGVRRKHVLRGTIFSLPKPKGGRRSRANPILCEDEMMMKLGRKARNKASKQAAADPLDLVAAGGGFATQSWQQFALGKGRDAALQITDWKNNPNERKNARTNRRR